MAGALPAPAVAEGRDDGQAPPALVISVRLAGLQVKRALVPRLDSKNPHGPVLTVSTDEWASFITRLQSTA